MRKITGNSDSTSSNRQKDAALRTLVPEEPVTIPHLPLADLREVENADAQTDVVQDAVRVLFVEFVGDCLFWWCTEMLWVYRDGVLTRILASGDVCTGVSRYLDDRKHEHRSLGVVPWRLILEQSVRCL